MFCKRWTMLPVAQVISTITLTFCTLDARFSSKLLAAGVAPSAYMGRLFPFRCMTPHWLQHTLTRTLLNVAISYAWFFLFVISSHPYICIRFRFFLHVYFRHSQKGFVLLNGDISCAMRILTSMILFLFVLTVTSVFYFRISNYHLYPVNSLNFCY
jgi:hypothetical protein